MSELKLFNTLSGKKERFVARASGKISMYACGPTVYDACHLGHARMAIVWDVIHRYLRYSGYDVTFVRNITDVDDKIINRARELEITPEQVAREYTFQFWKDMHLLNVAAPDLEPRATEFIEQMIQYIGRLIDKSHAYVSGSDVYFDVSSFPGYGKLKKQKLEDLMAGAREQVLSQEELAARKRNQLDFALWKACGADQTGWQSPWGRGRPGWHTECCSMIKHTLGDTIDIHGGGEDLIFPHHDNEIAQAESLTGKPLATYWLHNSFVQVDSEKMSKSLGNFYTIDDILSSYSPDTVRLFILQTHYRSPIEFTRESLDATRAGLLRLTRAVKKVTAVSSDSASAQRAAQKPLGSNSEQTRQVMEEYQSQFSEAMDNDFNTPSAVALLFHLADRIFQEPDRDRSMSYLFALETFAGVLGLTLADTSQQLDSQRISRIMDLVLTLRQESRERKDFTTADLIRNRLSELGIRVMDTAAGADWERA